MRKGLIRQFAIALLIATQPVDPSFASETVTYIYDSAGRIVRVVHAGTVNNGVQTTLTYDPVDNRANYSGGGGASVILVSDASVTEGSNLTFTVSRSGDTSTAVSVSYSTSDGSAVQGSDYTAASGTVTFAAGETSKSISVATIDDTAAESTETVFLDLTSPTGGGTIARPHGTGSIVDNDTTPVSFSVANAAPITEGGTLVFNVTKSGSTYQSVSVNYATADGTATAGTDYVSTSGTLTFATSETAKTVSVATIDDLATEPPETVLLNLSSPSVGSISTGQATGTINDNDTGPVTALNPSLSYSQDTSNVITIDTLVVINGNPVRITSFAVPSGDGTATIAGDGQSVTYNAVHVGTGGACEPAPKITFSVSYVVQNTSSGANTNGTASIMVKGAPGGRGRTCQ